MLITAPKSLEFVMRILVFRCFAAPTCRRAENITRAFVAVAEDMRYVAARRRRLRAYARKQRMRVCRYA